MNLDIGFKFHKNVEEEPVIATYATFFRPDIETGRCPTYEDGDEMNLMYPEHSIDYQICGSN